MNYKNRNINKTDKMTEKCKSLLQQIAYNESVFEKNEKLKNSNLSRQQKSISKLHSSKSLVKSLESQKFIEKLKIQIEKEKTMPLTLESPNSMTKIQKYTKKSSKFHLKSDYLPKQGAFLTQTTEFFLSTHNGFNSMNNFLKDEISSNEYYSKLTFEGLKKLKTAVNKFNKMGIFEKNSHDIYDKQHIYSGRRNNKMIRLARTGNEPIVGKFFK